MELKPRSKMATRTALLASTAIIALLTGCQAGGSGSSDKPASENSEPMPGGFGPSW